MLVKHKLVPKHELLSPEESQAVLDKFKITREQMPKISSTDPAIVEYKPNVGDIIKITRHSEPIGESLYYRVVVE